MPGAPDLENLRKLDLLPIPCIRQMQRVGIAVDLPYLAELSSELGREMIELEKDISSYIPHDALQRFSTAAAEIEEESGSATINANSAVQIRELLFDVLKVGRGRDLKRTGAGLLSTGRKNMDVCREDHPVIPIILQYRERSKLKSAFCDSLPLTAKYHPSGSCCPVCEYSHTDPTWRLHTTFTTTRAVTGRLSSKTPNLQQIPIRTALGSRIRAAFVASPGKRIISVDFSQMELRDLAHLANANSIIRIYEADGDIHLATAMRTFGIDDPALVDKYLHRLPSKRTNFGIQNGTTEKGLHGQLMGDYWNAGITPPAWLTQPWCKDFIGQWHDAYPEVQPYFDTQYYRARRYGLVWNPWGRIRLIPEVRSSLSWIVAEGLRNAQNFAVTSSNAEQTKLVMAECEEMFDHMRQSGGDVRSLLSIHDQVIAEAGEDIADLVGSTMVATFEGVMDDRRTGKRLWRTPIKADCEILERWKDKE